MNYLQHALLFFKYIMNYIYNLLRFFLLSFFKSLLELIFNLDLSKCSLFCQ